MLNFDEWNALLAEKNELKKIGAGVMIERPDGSVLLLRRSPGSSNPGKWCYPGGSVEDGEKAIDGATRECEEEIGGLPDGRYTGERSVFQIGRFRFVTFRYLCEDREWEPTLNPEHTEWAWCSPNKLSTYETLDMAGHSPVIDAANDMLDYRHSCAMVDMPREIAERTKRWARKHVDPADLAYVDGFEGHCHVTVMYGIRDKEPNELTELCHAQAPVYGVIGELDAFKSDDFDVLIARAFSPDLRRLRSWIRQRPHELTYPAYKPHMTLAYLKPGTADKYVNIPWDVKGCEFKCKRMLFSGWQGEERHLLLSGDTRDVCGDFAEETDDQWAE